MEMAWPSGTPRSGCRKVTDVMRQHDYTSHHGEIKFHNVSSVVLLLLQVLFLEIRTTSLAWVSLWTRILMRKSNQRYNFDFPPVTEMQANGQLLVRSGVKGLYFCVFCTIIRGQAQKKRYTPRTQVTTSLVVHFAANPVCFLLSRPSCICH